MNEEKSTQKCQQCFIEKTKTNFHNYKYICNDCRKNNIEIEIKNMFAQGVFPEKDCQICGLRKGYLLFYNYLWGSFGKRDRCSECENSRCKAYSAAQKSKNKTLEITELKCNICSETKPVKDFRKDCHKKNGFISICKNCAKSKEKVSVEEKSCSQCLKIQPALNFSKSSYSTDGLNSSCKTCKSDYQSKNKKRRNENNKIRRKNDKQFKIAANCRTRIYLAIKSAGAIKSLETDRLIGLSVEDFMKYLEKLFEPEMTLENYGLEWHIDHIIPCDSFDLTKESEQLKCFNYKNMMPRWATTAIALKHGSCQIGNIEKGARLILAPF